MKSKKSRICNFTGVSDSHLEEFCFLEGQEDKTQEKKGMFKTEYKNVSPRKLKPAIGQPLCFFLFSVCTIWSW